MTQETLAEQLAKIEVGDWVHAVFRMPNTPSGEWEASGEVYKGPAGGLLISSSAILRTATGSPDHYLLRIKEHRPAPRPFYTNRPATRQPRRGDQIEHPELGLLIHDGHTYWWQYSSGRAHLIEPGKYPLAGELFEVEP